MMNKYFDRFRKKEHFLDIPELMVSFSINMTDKKKAEFIKTCEKMSELFETPLFTFRCKRCEILKPIPEAFCQVVFRREDNDLLDVGFLCKSCNENEEIS